MQKFRGADFEIRIFDNRLEFTRKRGFFSRDTTIPFSSIADIAIGTFVNRLVIKTIDGKKHKFSFGLRRGKLKRCQTAIAEQM